MISFVWSPSALWEPPFPFIAGNGGSETSTLGYVRELGRRGLDSQIVTFRLGEDDGRESAPGVRFIALEGMADAATVDSPMVLLLQSLPVELPDPAFVSLLLPPLRLPAAAQRARLAGRRLIVPSHAMARAWGEALDVPSGELSVVHLFADSVFGEQLVPPREPGPIRVLFAGRLSAAKGIFTLFEALTLFVDDPGFAFTVVIAGKEDRKFTVIEPLVRAHPMITVVPSRPTRRAMAELLVEHDVVVMPTQPALWVEPFGMLSVEAQHAGCRVVASDVGGLPETDCGGLHLFESANPAALAAAIREAGAAGRLDAAGRAAAATHFTLAQSTDRLLAVLNGDRGPILRG
jgi:glycosyltransferase involved in cell wall biosynthesis